MFQGTPITYTLTALNNGPSDAQDVKIVDTIPPNAAFVFATPSAGGTCMTPAVGDAGPVVCTFPGPTPPNGARSVYSGRPGVQDVAMHRGHERGQCLDDDDGSRTEQQCVVSGDGRSTGTGTRC